LALLAGLFTCGCGMSDVGEAPADQWMRAEALWQRRDVDAYAAWRAVDPTSPEGRRARARLARADAEYRDGVRRLEGEGEGARDALSRGVAIAPMDPRLYARLGRACRARGLDSRAAEYFTKYLAALPDGDQARDVRAQLEQLDPELAGVFRPTSTRPAAPAAQVAPPSELRLLGLGALLGLLLAFTLGLVVRFLRDRGVSLARLAEERPELHPAIAYLVGSLRHELLKHRIGAASDALTALRTGEPSQAQLAFLRGRLFGGQPLREAWQGYVEAFERTLGRLDLQRDREFRVAGRQIRHIAKLEPRIAKLDPRAIAALAKAHLRLRAFDARLARMVAGLVRTRVDDALLAEIVADVQGEYAVSQVALDELRVSEVQEVAELEVFRVDLVLVLKNILRNAILATARAEEPRRVALDVQVELEATGEETVRVRVSDTSPEELRADMLLDRRVDRGLGLVAAAVTRYGGAIEVEPGSDGFHKAVVVSFFRAFDEGTEHDVDASERVD